tara:strand:+ start:890 stop:1312 length:423 start_codon:yes stop_codon:yes gene_type:complete
MEKQKETKKESLRRLFVENNLSEDDVYKDKRGFVIITRSGIEKIQFNNNMDINFDLEISNEELIVVKAYAEMRSEEGQVFKVQTYGECSPKNYSNFTSKFGSYPYAMAEKRALSRAVLKLAGFYRLGGVFGEGEIDNRDE